MDQDQTFEQKPTDDPSGSADFVESTDDRPIYEAWRAGGADEALAYTATQRVRDMAAVNAVTFMGAKIEVQGAELRAKIEAQGARIEAQGAKIEAQGAELGAKIEAQGVRIEAQGAELGAKIEAQRTVLAAHTTSLRWMMGILVAVFAALMVLLAQALREIPTPAPSAAAMQQSVEEPTGDAAPPAADSNSPEQGR